jgi:hypothetical protein
VSKSVDRVEDDEAVKTMKRFSQEGLPDRAFRKVLRRFAS